MKADIRICIPLIYTLISRIHLRDCEILLKRRLEGSGDFSDTVEASEGTHHSDQTPRQKMMTPVMAINEKNVARTSKRTLSSMAC